MKKIHGRRKKEFRIRKHLSGAKELKKIKRRLSAVVAKVSKQKK